jgi:hypothetical protein
MLAAPELVEPEVVEVGRQLEVTLELQGRALAEWMMRCQEGAEAKTR